MVGITFACVFHRTFYQSLSPKKFTVRWVRLIEEQRKLYYTESGKPWRVIDGQRNFNLSTEDREMDLRRQFERYFSPNGRTSLRTR